jgi:ethanolamine utilization cobalamin adenosyltransferase
VTETTWRELFDRADDYEVSEPDIIDALERRRDE